MNRQFFKLFAAQKSLKIIKTLGKYTVFRGRSKKQGEEEEDEEDENFE